MFNFDLKSIILGMSISVASSMLMINSLAEEADTLKESAVLIDSSVKAMNVLISKQITLLDEKPDDVYYSNYKSEFTTDKLEEERQKHIKGSEDYINETAKAFKEEITVNNEYTEEDLQRELDAIVLDVEENGEDIKSGYNY